MYDKPPIRRPADAWPSQLVEEYQRLAKLPTLPVEISLGLADPKHFACRPTTSSFAFDYCAGGGDYAGLLASVCWVKEGPKIVDINEEQFQALSQVEVRLTVDEFTTPYPTMLVNMPSGKMHRYVLLRLHKAQMGTTTIPFLIAASCSHDHRHDIVMVARGGCDKLLEETLATFYSEVTDEEAESTHLCARVAANMALAMVNFGCTSQYVFPHEAEQEKKFIAKGDRRGRDGKSASDRLAEQPIIVQLDREVKLYKHKNKPSEEPIPSGKRMPFHWVRGHWKMQPHGPKNSLRRRQYVAPYMVHEEDLLVDQSETTTVYKS